MYYSKLLNNFNNIAIKFKNTEVFPVEYTVNNISAKYVNDS